VPPSTFTQVSGVYPGLAKQAGQISSNVMSELQGVLSPETIDSINQHAAQFGVSSGMPLSGFAASQGLRSLGQNVEAVQHQGMQDYLSSLSGIGNAQLPPALLTQISEHNADLRAAPDPEMAAKQMIQNYQNAMRGYGGSTFNPPSFNPAGGTGSYTQDANLQNQPALQSTGGATMVGGVPQYQNLTPISPYRPDMPYYEGHEFKSQPYAQYEGSNYTSSGNMFMGNQQNFNPATGTYTDPATGQEYDQDGNVVNQPAGSDIPDFYGIPSLP
jgi:hypothetical protein